MERAARLPEHQRRPGVRGRLPALRGVAANASGRHGLRGQPAGYAHETGGLRRTRRRARQAHRALLRALRRPARGPARSLAHAAVRADAGRRPPLRARRGGQQGPAFLRAESHGGPDSRRSSGGDHQDRARRRGRIRQRRHSGRDGRLARPVARRCAAGDRRHDGFAGAAGRHSRPARHRASDRRPRGPAPRPALRRARRPGAEPRDGDGAPRRDAARCRRRGGGRGLLRRRGAAHAARDGPRRGDALRRRGLPPRDRRPAGRRASAACRRPCAWACGRAWT